MTTSEWIDQFDDAPRCAKCGVFLHIGDGLEIPDEATPQTLLCWEHLWEALGSTEEAILSRCREYALLSIGAVSDPGSFTKRLQYGDGYEDLSEWQARALEVAHAQFTRVLRESRNA